MQTKLQQREQGKHLAYWWLGIDGGGGGSKQNSRRDCSLILKGKQCDYWVFAGPSCVSRHLIATGHILITKTPVM